MKTRTIRGTLALLALLAGGCDRILGLEHRTLFIPDDGGTDGGATCSDGTKNGNETDKDCGGSCPPCGNGNGCDVGPDCESLVCVSGTCVDPTCSDKIKNGDETDVDCGGSCGKCGPGQGCGGPADCKSSTCTAGKCASTCADKLKGGGETDVDCGGPDCPACANGQICSVGGDCESGVCEASACKSNYVWGVTYGGGGSATPLGFAVASDGHSVLAGDFKGSVNLGSGPLTSSSNNDKDAFIAAFDPSGAPLWSKPFGDAQDQVAFSVAIGPSGNIALAGLFQGTINLGGGPLVSAGSYDAFVGVFSTSGVPLWGKQLGDSKYQNASNVAMDKDGNVAIMGAFGGTIMFGGNAFVSVTGQDLFIAKYDSSGNPIWFKQFGLTSSPTATSAAFDGAGNLVIAGNFGGTVSLGGPPLTSAGGSDIFLAQLDPSGGHLWSARFGDAGQQLHPQVAIDGTGSVVLGGNFTGTINFGGDTFASTNGNHVFLAKFDNDGHHAWSKQFGSDQAFPSLSCLSANDSGNIGLAGNFTGMLDLGGSPLVASSAGGDAFLATFDELGAPLWNRRVGGVQATFPIIAGIAFADPKYLLITGNFAGTVDFGGGPVSSTGVSDVFLVEYLTP